MADDHDNAAGAGIQHLSKHGVQGRVIDLHDVRRFQGHGSGRRRLPRKLGVVIRRHLKTVLTRVHDDSNGTRRHLAPPITEAPILARG